MGITILDVLFYSSVQLSKGLSKTANGGWISLILAGLGLTFAIFDLIQLCYFSFKQQNKVKDHETDSNLKVKQISNNNIYRKFASISYRKESVAKSKLVRSLNAFFLIRFAASQLIISLLQNSSGVQVISLFAINMAYSAYFVFVIIRVRKSCSSTLDLIQKIIAEVLLLAFHVMLLIFHSDPSNKKFSSDTTELLQQFVMLLVLVIVISQTLSFALAVIYKLKSKKSTDPMQENKGAIEPSSRNWKSFNVSQIYQISIQLTKSRKFNREMERR